MSKKLSPEKLRPIETMLESQVKNASLPGYVALIAQGDDVWAKSGGTMSYETAEPLKRDAIFRISSMSKPITAAAVLMLIDDGVMTLNDPIARWIPELAQPRVLQTIQSPLSETVPARREITVRDLMTFTFGTGMLMVEPGAYPILKAMDENGLAMGPPAPQQHLPPDEFIQRLGSLPLMYQPGETWLYHRAPTVLSILVARASGQDFEQFLKARLFEPLGMKDTGFVVPEKDIHRLPWGYMWNFQKNEYEVFDEPGKSQWTTTPPMSNGADGLVSTVDDYYRFANMLLHEGTQGGRRILSKESVQAMTSNQLTPSQRMGFFEGEAAHHGFGFGLQVVIKEGIPGESVGQYNWDGGLGTTWFVDPKLRLIALLMTQKSWKSPAPPDHVLTFNCLVHDAALSAN
ncbi:MAG: beta-lactamase family protein [Pseudobdellovibrionaceae bacterium]|nr:beta-lactamase family protein [Pseudobdellovibrionaceae bacterium]